MIYPGTDMEYISMKVKTITNDDVKYTFLIHKNRISQKIHVTQHPLIIDLNIQPVVRIFESLSDAHSFLDTYQEPSLC